MLVKKIYDASDMMEEFQAMNRDQFTYQGYEALIDLFNESEEPAELDVIAICCEFTEAEPWYIADQYNYTFDRWESWDDAMLKNECDEYIEELLEKMRMYTWAEYLGNGYIIYQNY